MTKDWLKKYENIPYESRRECLVCGKKISVPLIDLPDFPITEIYTDELVKEKIGFVDQHFHLCDKCGHGQIVNVIAPNLQYGNANDYHFRTSQSATAIEHTNFYLHYFNHLTVDQHFNKIVEIGCNDMYLLRSLRNKADELVGIDPILKEKEKEYSEDKILAIGDFFENVDICGPIDVVLCKDTLEHVSDPKMMIKKITDIATNDTLFVFQFPLLEALLVGCRFDQIFHQHLNYFSMRSIAYMLDELKCELIDYTINYNHFGSIVIVFRKKSRNDNRLKEIKKISSEEVLDRYAIFKNNMDCTNKRITSLKNERLYGYGAALMLPVLSYHLNNDLSCLLCVIDDDRNKEGVSYINLPIIVKTARKIKDIKEAVVLVTAISSVNNVRRILQKLISLNPRQIILPMNNI